MSSCFNVSNVKGKHKRKSGQRASQMERRVDWKESYFEARGRARGDRIASFTLDQVVKKSHV
jgi:hypothetical protein